VLPKINRLKKKKDFEKVFKEGKGVKESFLFLKFLPNNLKVSRFGFILSKKISKKTTVRNKIKRRLREIVRLELKKIKPGIDGVFVVSPGLENKNFLEIKTIVKKIFKKTKLYKNVQKFYFKSY
jgi:ribonuclease P protein component